MQLAHLATLVEGLADRVEQSLADLESVWPLGASEGARRPDDLRIGWDGREGRKAVHGLITNLGGHGWTNTRDLRIRRFGVRIPTGAQPNWPDLSASSPSQLAQSRITDAEVVTNLVDHSSANPLHDLLVTARDCADGTAVDGDPVGHDPCVARRAAGQRNSLIEPKQAAGPASCSTVTATLLMSSPSSAGNPSSASVTIASNLSRSTSTMGQLSDSHLTSL